VTISTRTLQNHTIQTIYVQCTSDYKYTHVTKPRYTDNMCRMHYNSTHMNVITLYTDETIVPVHTYTLPTLYLIAYGPNHTIHRRDHRTRAYIYITYTITNRLWTKSHYTQTRPSYPLTFKRLVKFEMTSSSRN
jgi:hypothetical protein